jgi:hypothetical protein
MNPSIQQWYMSIYGNVQDKMPVDSVRVCRCIISGIKCV